MPARPLPAARGGFAWLRDTADRAHTDTSGGQQRSIAYADARFHGASDSLTDICRVRQGQEPRRLLGDERDEIGLHCPAFSRDGLRLAYRTA